MTSNQLAALVVRWDHPPVLRSVPIPVPGPGQSLVRMLKASITHLDVTVASGRFGVRPELPYVGGVEGVGAVVSSPRLPVGTRVGIRGGEIGLGGPGCWAENVVVDDELLTPVPHGLSDELAATFFDPCTTAWVAVHDLGGVGPGTAVLVGGAAGAVGSVTAQLALRAGARVWGEVSSAARVPRMPVGVIPVVHGEGSPAPVADLLIDTVGGPRLGRSLKLVRPGGRAIVVGYTAGEGLELDIPNWMMRDVALQPLNMLRRAPAAERAAATTGRLLVDGELALRTRVHEFARIGSVVQAVRAGALDHRAVVELG